MRSIVTLACAFALIGGGAALAQSKTLGGYASQIGDTQVQTSHRSGSASEGPAAQPGAQTAHVGPYRPMHRRSLRACMRRADARGLHGRAKTRFLHYCQIGRA